ncbi:MAG: undecaprenyl-diphosphate phosphatase [Bacilli bacterium]
MIRLIELILVIILGIVQAFTEWLPISSTAHLIIVNYFFNDILDTDFFNVLLVVIQLASCLAVIQIFNKELFFKNKEEFKIRLPLYIKLIISMIPCLILGLLLDQIISSFQENLIIIIIALFVLGIVFLFIEKVVRLKKSDNVTYLDSLFLGLFQCIAMIFPGTSRSGITLIGGLILGYKKEDVIRFSFLMSLPIMIGASFLRIIKNVDVFTENNIILLLIGCVISYLFSLVVIRFLLKYIKKHTLIIFGIYRIILAIILLCLH